jgi:acetyl-CoA carboxylase biotin carboxyl carrier protein
MTGVIGGEPTGSAEAVPASTIAAVLHSALDLLSSMPERPQRLRVTALGVTVDLDWRSLPTPAPPPVALPAAVHAEPAGDLPSPARAALAPAMPGAVEASQAVVHFVCAPTVGTFYQAPEPGAAPFVEVGALVNAGQQVGIVEAMKLMLPVEADRAGRVIEVLVGNGVSVEYGQRLLALGPAD